MRQCPKTFPAIDSFMWRKGHLTGFQITSQRKVTKFVDLDALLNTGLGQKFVGLVMQVESSNLQQPEKHSPEEFEWTIYIIVEQDA